MRIALTVIVAMAWSGLPLEASARTPAGCVKPVKKILRGGTIGYVYKNTCGAPVSCRATVGFECGMAGWDDTTIKCRAGANAKFKCKTRIHCGEGIDAVRHKAIRCTWGKASAKPGRKGTKKGRTWVRDDKGFNVRVRNGYRFYRVRAYNHADNKCKMTMEVHFNSPNTNYIRFQAKVKFKKGTWLRTGAFHNTSAGSRMYTYSWDTSNDGCWGKKAQKPAYLWVTSCLARGCTPPAAGGR